MIATIGVSRALARDLVTVLTQAGSVTDKNDSARLVDILEELTPDQRLDVTLTLAFVVARMTNERWLQDLGTMVASGDVDVVFL